jgi:hypothetical protein
MTAARRTTAASSEKTSTAVVRPLITLEFISTTFWLNFPPADAPLLLPATAGGDQQ